MTHVLARSLVGCSPLCVILIMVKPLEIASGGRKLRRITYLRLTTTVVTNGHEIERRGRTSKGLQVRWVEEQSTAGGTVGLKFSNANVLTIFKVTNMD